MTPLPVIQPQAPRPLFVTTAARVRHVQGFYDEEPEGASRFRWMQARGVIDFEPDPEARFLELWILSEFRDLSQTLAISAGNQARSWPLVAGWAPLSVVVPADASSLVLEANKVFPREYYRGDPRTLAVRVRDVRLHRDPDRHQAVLRQYENSRLNQQELLEDRVALRSTPPSLGIDMHGVCNVKPPCVYCEWDSSKALEGDRATVPFTRETLREWGAFFDNSVTLINCSIGEPFMMRNLDELLEIFGRTGKTLQMTTNGQILTDRNIEKLLGLPIDLYISLDAATAGTYARLRNNTFDRIVDNLRRLIRAKGGRGRLPYVHLVFMPMRCNLGELEDFVRLAADLEVDRLVLRPLNYSDSITLDWDRAGYRFEYARELLPFDELVSASGRAARLCRALSVELADQMDFGGSMRDLFQDDFDREHLQHPQEPASVAVVPPPRPERPVGATTPAAGPTAGEATSPVEPGPGPADRSGEPDAEAAEPAVPSLGAEQAPACLEPWKSLYILRRGVLPCCYGGQPVAPMEEYRSAWNSSLMQAIRRELLRGRFHDYCLHSAACPIVRKAEQAKLLPAPQRLLQRGRHWWWRFNRMTGERPNRYLYLPIKRTLLRARGRGPGQRPG